MTRRKSVIDAVIQQLSPVLGSTTVVAVADLDLDGVDTVALVTVVVVLVVGPRVSPWDLPWALWWALRQRD